MGVTRPGAWIGGGTHGAGVILPTLDTEDVAALPYPMR